VLWVASTSKLDVTRGLAVLADPAVGKIAIANPRHAPYGRAAEAALKAARVYDAVQPKLVFGENVAQTAQFAQSGAADAGIIAHALALSPAMQKQGRFFLIPAELHPRLEQGGTILRRTAEPAAAREVFRGLEKGLMEVDFSGKVFIKQGTIYSYSGNLTFWVKDKRAGARPVLVIVTGTGRLILTDQDRELTFMQVTEEPVYVEPMHLLACEEGLQPRYIRLGDDAAGLEVVALEGRGMVALSVASKPLPLTVNPGVPVSVPAPSVIMWTGALVPHVVDDPEVYAVVMTRAGTSGRMVRLEGSGRVLVEQTAGP